MTDNIKLIESVRALEKDHGPDGWPAVQMKTLTALADALEAVRLNAAPVVDERKAFEAWIAKDGGDLSMFGNAPHRHYKNRAVMGAWEAWQARALLAAAPEPQAAPVPLMKDALFALEQLLVAAQNSQPDEGCEQSIALAIKTGTAVIEKIKASPAEPQGVPEPADIAETLPCPFCGSRNISDGEILTEEGRGKVFHTQSECQDCGAVGPKGFLKPGEVDYGSVKAIAAWNRRAAHPQQSGAAQPAVWFEDNNGAQRKTPGECQAFGANGVPYVVWVGSQRYIKDSAAHPQQSGAAQREPVFWYRPVGEDGLYEGPVHNNSVGGRMLREEKPGEWVPLYRGHAQPEQERKPLNAKIADQLRPFLKPGDKVIWREAFRWKDDEGVLSNHYEGMELPQLAEEFGYDVLWDFNMHHAAIVRRITRKESP